MLLDKTLLKHKFEWDDKGNMKKPKMSIANLTNIVRSQREEKALKHQADNQAGLKDDLSSGSTRYNHFPELVQSDENNTMHVYSSESES